MFTLLNVRMLLYGLGLWLGGTLILRFAGQRLLHPGNVGATLLLFALSFALMAWIVRRLCMRFGVPREHWPGAALSVALPTLLLDPFSSAFFPVVFPNIAPEAAGIFGGWMLCCCAGAAVGACFGR